MKKVLIADDTKSIRSLLSTCLEIEGFITVTASDGQQALSLIKSENFDMAFLDIKMPLLSGTEVLRKIREAEIKIPIIIMTAFATVKNAVECTKLGAVAYLQKPFSVDKVKSVLYEVKGFGEINLGESIFKVENKIENNLHLEAIEILKGLIALDPSNANLYLLFSKAYRGIGDTEKAKRFFESYEIFNK
ncbi:MAG: response regulator [Bacillota bacterium]|nr:response regulator [Bacillota bacterium]